MMNETTGTASMSLRESSCGLRRIPEKACRWKKGMWAHTSEGPHSLKVLTSLAVTSSSGSHLPSFIGCWFRKGTLTPRSTPLETTALWWWSLWDKLMERKEKKAKTWHPGRMGSLNWPESVACSLTFLKAGHCGFACKGRGLILMDPTHPRAGRGVLIRDASTGFWNILVTLWVVSCLGGKTWSSYSADRGSHV